MKSIQAIFAAMLIVILTINLVAIGFSVALNITFLRLEFYDEVLQKNQFYGQIRQWLFNRVTTELPNGHGALPYLEKALTENWLRDELLSLGGHLFRFLKGQSDQLPIIPVYKLFDRLDGFMNEAQLKNKDKLINYWFGPIPERVRFQDIVSVELFWVFRQLVQLFKWASWVMIGIFLVLFALLSAITRGIKQSLIWIGTSITAAGGIMLEISITANWILLSNGMIPQWAESLTLLKFPSHAVELLLTTFVEHFLLRINIIALLLILAGAVIITFCHFDRRLTVIK